MADSVPPHPAPGEQVTELLARVTDGDSGAVDDLMPLIYSELHAMASHVMRSERSDHTLQPTALVHEAYAKLVRSTPRAVDDRRHFLAIAARAMRQILADHARSRNAEKRGGHAEKVTLGGPVTPIAEAEEAGVDIGALHEALEALDELKPRHARVVELRYLAGLTIQEVASALDVSPRTVDLDWRTARAWLKARLAADGPPGAERVAP